MIKATFFFFFLVAESSLFSLYFEIDSSHPFLNLWKEKKKQNSNTNTNPNTKWRFSIFDVRNVFFEI